MYVQTEIASKTGATRMSTHANHPSIIHFCDNATFEGSCICNRFYCNRLAASIGGLVVVLGRVILPDGQLLYELKI